MPLVLALVLAACSDQAVRDGAGVGVAPSHRWSVVSGSFRSATGCRVEHRLFRPERPRTDVLVVLAHGFLRDQFHMEGLARQLAASGVPVATLSFCNSRLWDGGHVRNGLDMRRLADRLAARRVLYAGFSAGALSALLAARQDPRAIGVLTLDLVDDRGLGARTALGLEVPLVAIQGDPSSCNAWNNGAGVYAVSPEVQSIPVEGANHCDFESPSDWLCESLCARGNTGGGIRRQEIIEVSAAAVERLLGLDEVGVAVRAELDGP